MTTFLHLPREIREHIIEFAVLHKDIRAESIADRPSRAEVHDGFNYFSRTQGIGIKWPKGHADANLTTSPCGLLLSNKRVREETLYVIGRQTDQNPHLDVLLVEEDEIWPTWTYIPAVPNDRPRVINCTIRMSGLSKEEHNGFEEESNLVTLWRFSSLLERMLRCTWKRPISDDVDEEIKLTFLNLNFLSPTGQPLLPEPVQAHWAQRARVEPGFEKHYIHPIALAMSMANWVSVTRQYRSLNEPFMDHKHDILHLFERIGTMVFSVDGRSRHTEIISRT